MNTNELFLLICKTKENMLNLTNEKLKKFKINFYANSQKTWQLDLLWEYLWDDISLEEAKKILKIN